MMSKLHLDAISNNQDAKMYVSINSGRFISLAPSRVQNLIVRCTSKHMFIFKSYAWNSSKTAITPKQNSLLWRYAYFLFLINCKKSDKSRSILGIRNNCSLVTINNIHRFCCTRGGAKVFKRIGRTEYQIWNYQRTHYANRNVSQLFRQMTLEGF